MRSVIVVSLISVALSAPSFLLAEGDGTTGKGPKAVAVDPVWDFGIQPQHATLTNNYTIRNAGDADLKIIRVISACQCAAVMPAKTVLGPGEETTIKVTMRTLTFEGRVTKLVTVVTNDPVQPNLKLTITGDVSPPYRVRPKELNLGTIGKNDAASQDFSVIISRGVSVRIKDLQPSDPHVKVEVVEAPKQTAAGDTEHHYRATLLPGLPVGHIRQTISVMTDSPNRRSTELPVLASIQGEVLVQPRTFNLGKVPQGSSVSREIEIAKSGDANLEIENVEVSPAGVFSAELIPVKAGASYKVRVSLNPEAPPRYHRGRVVIKTNIPGERIHQAYFYAYVTRKT
jgi:hypothetical protein